MPNIATASPAELAAELEQLEAAYEALQRLNLSLDLTRGKPSTEQVALSDALDGVLQGDFMAPSGIDVRNYGGLDGLPEARTFFGAWLDAGPDQTLIGGNSSLSLMYLVLDYALNQGIKGLESAWGNQDEVRFLCPVPGYDRHFGICEHLGIEMVNVPLLADGPDMDRVEELVANDPAIKGIWCVPRFSNPTGTVYSDAVVQRIAELPAKAGAHFLVMWDNAYAVHAFSDCAPALASIRAASAAAGTQDHVFQFGSTSKVTLAGAGVSFLATSTDNLTGLKQHLGFATIGPDKVNQLRHLRFLEDMEGVLAHMDRHAQLVKPRFQALLEILDEGLGKTGMGTWTRPEGGYFISFESLPGLATEIVKLADNIGVKLTPAGATFPYGRDPQDSNIRLAPTYPSLEDLRAAGEAFVVCVKLASVQQALAAG